MTKRKLICVILAAGKGTRMKSALPKVLHAVAGRSMLGHVIAAAEALRPEGIVVVVGPGQEEVVTAAVPHETALQINQLGTGDAVRSALRDRDLTGTDVLVLFGDVPLVPPESLRDLYTRHQSDDQPGVTILGMRPESPKGYGRLVTDEKDYVTRVVEELDASEQERAINLCSSGMMILRGDKLNDYLARIKNDNAKGEYYLLDVLPLMRGDGAVAAYVEGPADDLNGVNDRAQLAIAESRLQNKLRHKHMMSGVTLIDPSSVYFSTDTEIGNDVTIEPNVVIGPEVKIEPGAKIKAFSYLANVYVESGANIGPFSRIREKSRIGKNSQIGNFVEVKKSNIGAETKASHLTYLCDLDVGSFVNIGVGALFSNWDGVNKYRTKIGDYVFVGANATVVSPVEIGNSSFVTAGSTITENVPDDTVAFGRARQVNRDHTEKTILFSQKKKGQK